MVGYTAGYTKLARELIAALRESVTLEESGAKELKVGAAFGRALQRGISHTTHALSRKLLVWWGCVKRALVRPGALFVKGECRALFLSFE